MQNTKELSSPPPEEMWQTKQNMTTTYTKFDQERKERAGKPKHNKSTFEAAAAVLWYEQHR